MQAGRACRAGGCAAPDVRQRSGILPHRRTVGLFNRLYLDASAETAVEDYGLSAARLLHTPLLCGLAALGGALIVPLLSVQINPNIDPNSASIAVPTLDGIFNIAQRRSTWCWPPCSASRRAC